MKKVTIILFTLIFSIIIYPQSGFLSVESSPSGASVSINGIHKGTTPTELISLPVGYHTISVSYQTYESQSFRVLIKENEVSKKDIRLKKSEGFRVKPGETEQLVQKKGKLTIITKPGGANVWIDGEPVSGRTPFTVEEIGAGVHRVRIKKWMEAPINNFLEIEEAVEVKANKTELLNIDFDKYLKQGSLMINSNKSDLYVEIDHLNTGNNTTLYTPVDNKFLIGRYKLSYWFDEDSTKKSFVDFEIFPDRTTNIYLPASLNLPSYLYIRDHEDYVSYQDYIELAHTNHKLKYLPEKEAYTVTKFRWNGWFNAALYTLGSGLLYTTLASDDSKNQKMGYTIVASLSGIMGLIGFISAFEEEVAYREIPNNIEKNKITKKELQKSWEILYKKWERDIEEINKIISEERGKIEEDNKTLPQPSVIYK